jgi:DNA-binding CsgD family transcriptional regulator
MGRTDAMRAFAGSSSDGRSELLERSRQFSALAESLAAVLRSSQGRLVLVGGEAGVGKTALMRRFCAEQGRSTRVLWGDCDALFTPRPLGPLFDIASMTGGELEEVVQSDARPHEVAAALLRELQARAPTILVLEDLHWADEATLDVLRLLGRRVEAAPALVLASYRDDELGRIHPLRIVLGEIATRPAIDHMQVAALSLTAVAKLAEPHGVDPVELYGKTTGNPFFVTEVLATGEQEIPDTVRDAVLARVARLRPAARGLLDAVSVVPPQVELTLLQVLAGEAVDHLEECLRSGILRSTPEGVAFRHELARLTVEESLAPNRRVALHQKALAALADPPSGAPDPARLAHHAEATRNAEAVLQYAPAAATRAASLGSHREAAAQYARALHYADGLTPQAQAELLERRSHECYLTDQFGEAIEAQEGALGCHREVGDALKEGDSLRRLSRLLGCGPARRAEAREAGREAVALLERLPPGRELAMAYSNVSQLCLNAEEAEGAIAWGTRAIELAQQLDDVEILVHALSNVGAMESLLGVPAGMEKLERSLELAEQAGLDEHVGRAFTVLAWAAAYRRSYALANSYLETGLEYCSERDLDLWRLYLLAYRARAELDQGRWAEAADSAGLVLRDPRSSLLPRILALVVLGLVRARRGDPDHWPPLQEALGLAQRSGEALQDIAPVAAARAEAAWLAGKNDAVTEATEAALDLAVRRHASSVIGELACWRWRAGIREEIPPEAAEPYALQLQGEWAPAATLWTEIGCPYEAALALADADDDDALFGALAELQQLGARPAAAIVARRLRKRGARTLPRGPRPATRENPANLTPRELEVLALVAQGLRNADIAERLFLAPKTVDHHVSAILRKLSVPTRRQASVEAVRLGLAGQDR